MNQDSVLRYGIKILSLIILLTIMQQSNGQKITSNQTGINNGFYYSFWNDGNSGSASMTLEKSGKYKTAWCHIGNFTAGKGWATGKADRVISFSGSFNGGENGYLAVYGWTRNVLIEYYVVENYGDWVPPGGISKGTFDSDGGTYNIYETTRTNQPSIDGNQTFQQYWSVRTTKRSRGVVTFANHVAAWKKKGMNLGTT
ncbi:MAG: glycoside hydrolase family 11 protein, partial [Ginsengibacter sp.]